MFRLRGTAIVAAGAQGIGDQMPGGGLRGRIPARERDAELLVGVHHRACWGLGRRSVSNEDASRCAPALRSHIGREPDEHERLAPAPAAPVNSLALIETG